LLFKNEKNFDAWACLQAQALEKKYAQSFFLSTPKNYG
jgi:hypothetical protein